jgi:hypothetical protein
MPDDQIIMNRVLDSKLRPPPLGSPSTLLSSSQVKFLKAEAPKLVANKTSCEKKGKNYLGCIFCLGVNTSGSVDINTSECEHRLLLQLQNLQLNCTRTIVL